MFKTYTIKYIKGSVPGDQCVSWWTDKDWDRYREYVKELKASGEYGKEEEVDISLWYDPVFDDVPDVPPSYGYSVIKL